MKYYTEYITELRDNECFVFGSNLNGWHGAGSAGYASFNVFGNVWRQVDYGAKSDGWRGKWNVKGVAEGYQAGTEGRSYAIPSVTKPGERRSIPLDKIKESIIKFGEFAENISQMRFYVAQDAKMGYNGYTAEEMASCWATICPIDNVYFYKPFYDLLAERITLPDLFS